MKSYVYEALILMKKPFPYEYLNEDAHEYILKRNPNIFDAHDTYCIS